MGPPAVEFLDVLVAAGQSLWQMLPLTPPGAFQSPFDCRSAFAGNWLLISPRGLIADGLSPPSPEPPRLPPTGAVRETSAREYKEGLLRASWQHFKHRASAARRERFEAFREAPEQSFWLDDWALFAALESRQAGRSWDRWAPEMRRREPAALERARRELGDEIGYQEYLQFLFFHQFRALRDQAHQRGIRLIGDLPMYVSYHSADVWAHPRLFELDAGGRPLAVAGVPPDAFSAAGQRWGNPLYRWARHRELGFEWWIERLRTQTSLTDLLRLDHFRGFVAYWRVPAEAIDARSGRWARGPGRRLFEAVAAELDISRLIAEDLGHITPPVHRLRKQLGLRGMKVLQFAFDVGDSDHLPQHHEASSIVYTGTHDNDTLAGWFGSLGEEERQRVVDYLGVEASIPARELTWQLVRVALESVAELAILPLQDVLGLGSESRMNMPGTTGGNWRWRMERQPGETVVARLRRLVVSSGRLDGRPGAHQRAQMGRAAS